MKINLTHHRQECSKQPCQIAKSTPQKNKHINKNPLWMCSLNMLKPRHGQLSIVTTRANRPTTSLGNDF